MLNKRFIIILAVLIPNFILAQSLTWTGATDNDFYNEQNWVITGTDEIPSDGTLETGVVITEDLFLMDANIDLTDQSLSFTPTTNGITLENSDLVCNALISGFVKVVGSSTLILNDVSPLGDQSSLDIDDAQGWIKMPSVDPYVADSVYLDQIKSKDQSLVLGEDVRINQYYFGGSLVRLIDEAYKPLTLFDEKDQAGDSFELLSDIVNKREQLGDFDNKTSSFRLERGYQVAIAIFQNGTGKSQLYIASEEALEIDLPFALDNNISFVRVTPWNWVTKKGASAFDKDLNHTWVYNWGNGSISTPNKEYAPMSWGGGGATAGAVASYIQMENITHVMGFNESDNCNGQSGQYGGLCQIEIAVPTFKNLMSSGLRLVSPSPRENGPFTWLKDFRDEAIATDVRYDVLGVHWYDWGANPKNSPFEDPEKVFTRFKNYLNNVYNEHGMPIWITEFNANANRDMSVHIAFMKLALPYLETLDFVERYDYFSVNPEVADNREDIVFGQMFNEDGSLTELGVIFKEHQSTPSLPEATWSSPSFLTNLDTKIGIQLEVTKDTLREGDFMVLRATTDRSVGSPQTFAFQLENLASDQYILRDIELTIPEGGAMAETNLVLIDDDEIEDTLVVNVTIVPVSDGIQMTGSAGEFVMVSEDVAAPLSTARLENSLLIWPNPAVNTFHIGNQPINLSSIELVSIEGRRFGLIPNINAVYNIDEFASGLYLLSMKTKDNQVIMQRVIIK